MTRVVRLVRIGVVAVIVAAAAVTLPTTARADPVPGFDLDPVQLEHRMQQCVAYSVPEGGALMAWVNMRTGETRTWRCSSLRHMLFDDLDRPPHDPFSDIPNFMRCVDRVVSYGFPAKQSTNGNRLYTLNQRTSGEAHVVVNEATNDIATIYMTSGTWAQCVSQL